MSHEPLVTVVIPVYNVADYLAQCLRSVLEQTWARLEVVAVDDGSTDGSGDILRRFAADEPRLRVLVQDNGGVSSARNAGLGAARGDWVMFVDSDDFLADSSVVATVMEAADADADVVLFDEAGRPAGAKTGETVPPEAIRRMLVDETFNVLWNKAYRRELIEEHACRFRPDIRMGEDLLFNIHVFRHVRRTVRADVEGYVYRRGNASSATNSYRSDKYRDLMTVNDELAAWAAEMGDAGLASTAGYIRAKNILSCISDLHHRCCSLSVLDKVAVVEAYKRDDPVLAVSGIGLREWAVGRAYSHADARTLFSMTRILSAVR